MQLSVYETDSKRSHYSGKGFYIWWFYLITVKEQMRCNLFSFYSLHTLFGVGIYNDMKTDSRIFF